MPRPGFVLEVDRSAPSTLFWHGEGFRLERLPKAFWIGAAITFGGVALIAVANGSVGSSLNGTLIAIATALTWAFYTVAIAPLMRRYSPFRISALVLAIGWLPLALVSIPQVPQPKKTRQHPEATDLDLYLDVSAIPGTS